MQSNNVKKRCKDQCYIESICSRCDFFHGPDDELECAAYQILLTLVENGVISVSDISNARISQPNNPK